MQYCRERRGWVGAKHITQWDTCQFVDACGGGGGGGVAVGMDGRSGESSADGRERRGAQSCTGEGEVNKHSSFVLDCRYLSIQLTQFLSFLKHFLSESHAGLCKTVIYGRRGQPTTSQRCLENGEQ